MAPVNELKERCLGQRGCEGGQICQEIGRAGGQHVAQRRAHRSSRLVISPSSLGIVPVMRLSASSLPHVRRRAAGQRGAGWWVGGTGAQRRAHSQESLVSWKSSAGMEPSIELRASSLQRVRAEGRRSELAGR